jgi:hypothetical protein
VKASYAVSYDGLKPDTDTSELQSRIIDRLTSDGSAAGVTVAVKLEWVLPTEEEREARAGE